MIADDKNIEISISKEELNKLPVEKYKGEIVVVSDPNEIENVIQELREASLVGFDTETKPAFQKGQINNVALMQLATDDKCFLIRITHTGLHQALIDYLEDADCIKIGLSIKDDFHNLSKIKGFKPKGFIDLQEYVKRFHITDCSLTKIHGIVFGTRISKSQQLSNWEAPVLTSKQQEYAALDAKACINIYRHLASGEFEHHGSSI